MASLVGVSAVLWRLFLSSSAARGADAAAELFRRPAFTGAQVAAFAISASFFALFLYTTLYLQEILHLSPIQAGLVYLPGTM